MYQPINYRLLKSKGACAEELALFKEHFGVKKSVPLTEAVARKFGTVFNIDWAAENLLSYNDYLDFQGAYESHIEEYVYATTKHMNEYDKAEEKLWYEYKKRGAGKLMWDEYEESLKPFTDKYNKATKPACDKYKKAKAIEFVRIYKRGLTSKKRQ